MIFLQEIRKKFADCVFYTIILIGFNSGCCFILEFTSAIKHLRIKW